MNPGGKDMAGNGALFVYDTLLCPSIYEQMSGERPSVLPASLPGFRRWSLWREGYSAVVADGEPLVRGAAVLDVSPGRVDASGSLRRLDVSASGSPTRCLTTGSHRARSGLRAQRRAPSSAGSEAVDHRRVPGFWETMFPGSPRGRRRLSRWHLRGGAPRTTRSAQLQTGKTKHLVQEDIGLLAPIHPLRCGERLESDPFHELARLQARPWRIDQGHSGVVVAQQAADQMVAQSRRVGQQRTDGRQPCPLPSRQGRMRPKPKPWQQSRRSIRASTVPAGWDS